jgi:hypothetical protein
LVLTMSPTSFYGAEALAEDRSSHRDALLHRVVSDPHRQQDAAPSNNWPTCCSARAKTPELARAHEALAQVSTLSMCARDMRRPAGTPGGRGQDGPRAGTRAEAPRTSAVVFALLDRATFRLRPQYRSRLTGSRESCPAHRRRLRRSGGGANPDLPSGAPDPDAGSALRWPRASLIGARSHRSVNAGV